MSQVIHASLDRMRRNILLNVLSSAPIRSVIVHKDRRIALQAAMVVLGATALSLFVPLVPLLIIPLVLGVPHLASEFRWLVLRRRLPLPLAVMSAPIGLALAALGLLTWLGRRDDSAPTEVMLACSWMVGAACCGWGKRRLCVAFVATGLAASAVVFRPVAVVFRDMAIGAHAFVTLNHRS